MRPPDGPSPARPTGSLWGGRFSGGMAPEMVPLNLSLDVDRRLWRHDIQGSMAWAQALVGAGVLTSNEGDALRSGLTRVEARLATAGLDGPSAPSFPDEDIHSLVERLLYEEIGEVAGKLHTGRSRNDQVATDFRLWGMEAAAALAAAVEELSDALLELADRTVDLILPGYTHLQQGQPIRGAHWALSHFWPLLRDRKRFDQARAAAATLPLGSGALAGSPFPVDRERLAQALGFQHVSENSMDAVSDRDWAAELLFAAALTGSHISRLGEDMVLFSSTEFGFLRLSDAYSTGSSLMPQKRNPDVAELARGRAGRLLGNLTALLATLKGLPTGYNRDLQEDKRIVFDSVDALAVVLPALAGAVRTAEFRTDRVHAALDTKLLATDLADYLVRKGVPFRRSHDAIGHLVRRAEELSCQIEDLSDAEFKSAHPAFGPDVREVFDWERSVDSRATRGGTARSAIEQQLTAARAALTR
jgi:argininosuccinate lyase